MLCRGTFIYLSLFWLYSRPHCSKPDCIKAPFPHLLVSLRVQHLWIIPGKVLYYRVNASKEPNPSIQVNKLSILYIDLGQVTCGR